MKRYIVPAFIVVETPATSDVADHEAACLAESANLGARHLEETLLPGRCIRTRLLLDELRPTLDMGEATPELPHTYRSPDRGPTELEKEQAAVIGDLLEWAASLGGWEAEAWKRARRCARRVV